ncbi:MAG: GNAT family N-acetyltransferase [Acidobacteriaceae bacterium]|nr:GNAT family N-acetyltransferase [Acidobacteriaceae bacterium]MBV9765628.1 GNAT family N-acetyltransferase [Acidobacteriaceae bacterium]
MAAAPEFVIEKLTKEHDLSGFDCGNDALNLWLKRFAWINVSNDTARVYVAHRDNGVVAGYHALVAGSVSREEAPERIGRGLAAHPIGVVVLARLAVTRDEQGKGLGTSLLQDALLRAHRAAEVVGVRAVLVHAINPSARAFYLQFGFSPSLIDDMRLLLLMKDLRAFLRTH